MTPVKVGRDFMKIDQWREPRKVALELREQSIDFEDPGDPRM
jgi:hypothetical protein